MRSMTMVLTVMIVGLSSAVASTQTTPVQTGDQATVWYLRHAGWAVRLWGTVTANRTDIDALRRGRDVLTTQLRSVSDDTADMRGQLNALTTHVLESEKDDE